VTPELVQELIARRRVPQGGDQVTPELVQELLARVERLEARMNSHEGRTNPMHPMQPTWWVPLPNAYWPPVVSCSPHVEDWPAGYGGSV
jgi:hypothetical protein